MTKHIFYASYEHQISSFYESETIIHLIHAETREEAIRLLRPHVITMTDEEYYHTDTSGMLSNINLWKVNFSGNPVVLAEKVYTGD